MSITALALGVAAQYLPDLVSKFTGNKSEVVAKVIDAAKLATGNTDAELALKAYKPSTADLAALRADVLSVITLEVKDIQHAREVHKDDTVTDHLSYQVMYLNPIYICIGIGSIVWLCTQSLPNGVLATASALIGAGLNQLYQERQQVMNYRFGSSLGEKLKELKR